MQGSVRWSDGTRGTAAAPRLGTTGERVAAVAGSGRAARMELLGAPAGAAAAATGAGKRTARRAAAMVQIHLLAQLTARLAVDRRTAFGSRTRS